MLKFIVNVSAVSIIGDIQMVMFSF